MQRAAVLIGVKKAGNLGTLQAVADGVYAMERWALSQGMRRELVKVLTDEAGRLSVQRVKDAIKELVDLTTLDQLIVYFAGHGVNIRYGEYWLLSDAPDDPQAAINLEGSVVLARQCGIPHVVIVSDACRSAAEGIQAQLVSGSEMFPNTGGGGPERGVDIFFACTLGRPALEVKDAADAEARFKAVYTTAFIEVLAGGHHEVLEKEGGSLYVRPWPVKRFLPALVTQRLAAMGVQPELNQTPDARITSDPAVWLSRLPAPAGTGGAPPAGRLPGVPAVPIRDATPSPEKSRRDTGTRLPRVRRPFLPLSVTPGGDLAEGDLAAPVFRPERRQEPPAPGETLRSATRRRLRAALTGWPPLGEESLLREAAQDFDPAQDFYPARFPTGCGFLVHGARFERPFSRPARSVLVRDSGAAAVGVELGGSAPAANVLLSFDNASGAVLPAIQGLVASLTFEDGELVNVAYEPVAGTEPWYHAAYPAEQLRGLRSLIAASARAGLFRPEGDDALLLARRMQTAKGVDPTTALYSAYAYADLGRRDLLSQMHDHLESDLGLRLFDLALLSGHLDGARAGRAANVFPFVPLLAQGWALLAAHRLRLPPALGGIERHLRQSLWTLFDAEGVAMIRSAMIGRKVA
jgi:hypothetical protein